MPATAARAQPFVSVVVPHYQDLAGLEICLVALEAQTYPKDRFEVVVADNNSPVGLDAVAAVVRDRARLICVKEKGAGPARNGAVVETRGEILAFIDSDCVAQPEWLEAGVEALDRFDLVGGKVRVLVSDLDKMTNAEAFERVFAFDFKTYIEKKGFTGAGNMFCARALFDRVGGFGVGMSEDVDWSRRAVAGGARLGYAPRAEVGHPARVTWEQLSGKWRRINAETYGLTAGQKHRELRWLARNALLPASIVAHAPKVLVSPELNSFGQRLQALWMLVKLRLWRLGDAIAIVRAR